MYTATDENSNTSVTPFNFTINVVDVSRPIITYSGTEFKDGNPYLPVEAGVATDLEDETLMQLEAVDSKGNTITNPDVYLFKTNGYSYDKLGSYVIEYKVEDLYGKSSLPFKYAIDVIDAVAPTISGATSLSTPLSMGTSINLTDYTSLGINVVDGFDTSPSLMIHDDGGFNKNKPGTYTIKYDATDDSGNLYSNEHSGNYYTYAIQVTDQIAPSIIGSTAETISAGTPIDQSYIEDYSSRGLVVEDNYDASPSIIANYVDETGSTIVPDSSKIGNILVNYDAVDASGNKYSDPLPVGYGQQFRYTIHVVDNVAPEITGATEKDIDFGLLSRSFDPLNANSLGLIITDNVDVSPQLIFAPDSDIYDGEKVGTYNMKYQAVDNDNNVSIPYDYTITVSAEPPKIKTSGDQLVTIDSSVTDDWITHPENVGISATGEDGNFDGTPDDLTSLITVKENGGFDATTAGTYPVEYQVIDPISGLTATAIVNVIVQSPAGASFYGLKSNEVALGARFDIGSSTATKLYVFTDRPMTIEEAIADGILTIINYGTDNDETTTADNFVGNGFDPAGTYLIEYVATYNGIETKQQYPIEVKAESMPHIIGKSEANYFSSDPIPYKSGASMGLFGLSSIFSDITADIEYTSAVDDAGDPVTLNTTGGNLPGVYTLQYDLHDPISGLDAKPYYYTITISDVKNPTINYAPPTAASDEKGMISNVYDGISNNATETWQSGYNANLLDPAVRFTAKSGDGVRDIPVTLSTDGGYTANYKTPDTYNVEYVAMDNLTDTSTIFDMTLIVKDTLPPQFFGNTSYTITQGNKLAIDNISLFTVDNSDGLKQSWSDTVSPDHMTITDSKNVVDPSIHFKGDGTDIVGDYLITVTTEDTFSNSSTFTIQVSVAALFSPPVFTGTTNFYFDLGNSSFVSLEFTSYGSGKTQISKDMIQFTDYLGQKIPYLEGEQNLKPSTNNKYGVFYAGGDHDSVNGDGTYYSLVADKEVLNETYCGTDNVGQTTCQAVVITGKKN